MDFKDVKDFNEIVKKIGIFVSDFVETISEDVEITFDNYTYCYTDVPTIVVCINPYKTKIEEFHEEYYKMIGYDFAEFGISFKTFALLHEIGHIETDVSEEEEEEHYKMQSEINQNVKLNDEPLNDTLLKYYSLPLEKLADEWAWNYLKENVYEMKIFDNMYIKLLNKLKECE